MVLKLIYEYNHVHLIYMIIKEQLILKFLYIHGSHTSSKVPKSGVPTISKIFVNWSIWSVPAKSGLRRINSAIIQPTDHISTFSS